MKGISKRQTAALIICVCSALLSVVVMINQVSLTSRTTDILAANKNAAVNETTEAIKNTTSGAQSLNIPETTQETAAVNNSETLGKEYVINKNSKKIHSPDCRYAENMKGENREEIVTDSIDDLLKKGYSVCSACGAQ